MRCKGGSAKEADARKGKCNGQAMQRIKQLRIDKRADNTTKEKGEYERKAKESCQGATGVGTRLTAICTVCEHEGQCTSRSACFCRAVLFRCGCR